MRGTYSIYKQIEYPSKVLANPFRGEEEAICQNFQAHLDAHTDYKSIFCNLSKDLTQLEKKQSHTGLTLMSLKAFILHLL